MGYAAVWMQDRKNTWSGTTWGMLNALSQQTNVEDIDLSFSRSSHLMMKMRYATYNPKMKRVMTQFKATVRYNEMLTERLDGILASKKVRAVISTDSPVCSRVPLFIYQDMILPRILQFREAGIFVPEYHHLSKNTLLKLDSYLRRAFDAAAGIISMSEWDRSCLIEQQYVPAEKVRVSPPGINVLPAGKKIFTDDGVNRVLFVGKDFFRKGGLETLRGCDILHRDGHRVELTIAGPERWPLDTPIPPFVRFLGLVPFSSLPAEFARANTFCMPSMFEALGIVFPEALAAGLPCIAMNMNAAPEIIQHGKTGLLLDRCEPEDIARAILECYANPQYRENVAERESFYRSHYSWDQAARRVLDFVDA